MKEHQFHTLIVGSGAAAYNAAHWMKNHHHKHSETFAIVTEGRKKGTSRNTGSDKQTYYKLAISGGESDSVRSMAETLFSGGGMDGDLALCEAAGSLQSFLKLANLGIPFPTNEYGEFVGYKTDHDPFHRATSAGPLTSKYMVETLEKEIEDVRFFDQYMACKIFTKENKISAVLCLNTSDQSFHLFHVNHLIWCTGGPASAYYYSVFPGSQTGMTGALLEAGAMGKNLGEWQYGLASVKFRWNVSGSYQQVIPRYFSIDEEGKQYDFLENVPNFADLVFLKGYQWPFDVQKADQSSLIDRLVHAESVQGRKVYMDFRTNPKGLDFSKLSQETYEYMEKSKILTGTPIERLEKMNPLAIEIYKNHQIDLKTQPLEVMVSAQHHNGGIQVDKNWETSISGLYACGEVASTLGVYRPGGSALNSSQVGSMRAVAHIKQQEVTTITPDMQVQVQAFQFIQSLENLSPTDESISIFYQAQQKKMSQVAAHVRNIEEMSKFLQESYQILVNFPKSLKQGELPLYLKTYDMLLTQCALLDAMILTAKTFGSRGSAFIEDAPQENLSKENQKVLTIRENGRFQSKIEDVLPIPEPNNWFETVWADYRKRNHL